MSLFSKGRSHRIVGIARILAAAAVLAACGGGGPNAGTCFGSAAVCGLGGSSGASTNGSGSGAGFGSNDTCETIANRFSTRPLACQAAQEALRAGNLGLDADNDGLACENLCN